MLRDTKRAGKKSKMVFIVRECSFVSNVLISERTSGRRQSHINDGRWRIDGESMARRVTSEVGLGLR